MGSTMWGRLLLAGCALAVLAGGVAVPSFAALTPATDSSYEENYSYAAHAPLFGSREVYSDSTWRFAQWTDMLARADAEFEDAQHVCTSLNDTHCVPAEWQALVDQLKGHDLHEQIDMVNQAMNRHPYVTTMQNWHRSMYWETAFEFLRYGGQCQDYAIAKYLLLRAAGVPADRCAWSCCATPRSASITPCSRSMSMASRYCSTICAATLCPASSVSDYRPYYSINENGWWYHFGGQAMTRVAGNYR